MKCHHHEQVARYFRLLLLTFPLFFPSHFSPPYFLSKQFLSLPSSIIGDDEWAGSAFLDKNLEIRAKQFDVKCSSLFVLFCIRGNGVDPFSAFSQTCVCCVSLSSSPSSSPNAVLPCLQIESPSVRPSDLMIGKSLRGYIFRETRQRRDDVRESLNVEESLVHVSYSSSSLLLLSMASSPASSFFSYRSCRTREGKGMSHTKKCIGRAKVEGNKREIQSRRRGRIQVTDSSFVAAKANSGELALRAI